MKRTMVIVAALSVGCLGRTEPHRMVDATPDVGDERRAEDQDASTSKDASSDASAPPPVGTSAKIPRAVLPDVGVGIDCPIDLPYPKELGCTGLYSNWPRREIAEGVREFDPAFHLWSDGASKRRFIQLPADTQIDTSDMDEWSFPVGTKLWKEFTVEGKLVETRYLEKQATGTWIRATYAWSFDQNRAEEIVLGAQNALGTGYDIPRQADCITCHQGRIDGVLGFDAVGLSDPRATGLTLQELAYRGLLTDPPRSPIRVPGSAVVSSALGYLHANCGTSCHSTSPNAVAGYTGLHMRLVTWQMAAVQTTDTWLTSVNVPARFQPLPGVSFFRIAPRNVAGSLIPFRDGQRDDGMMTIGLQMPPLGTRRVDQVGLATVMSWINAM